MRWPVMSRSLWLLILAVAAGIGAAFMARQHLNSRVRALEAEAAVPMVERVVAAFDLPTGTTLDAVHLATRQYPRSLVSSDSLDPAQFQRLLGHALRVPLKAGDLVLPAHVRIASDTPFSSQLAAGRRAITLPVDVINSVSGLLEPGDLIDLYVSFDYQRRRITAPLMQGVLVLATGVQTQFAADDSGRSANGDNDGRRGYSTVTLDTSPEEAVKLVAARQGGTLTAVLRRQDDNGATQKAVRGDLASLLGVARDYAFNKSPRRAPVIYGNTQARNLPGLKPGRASQPQPSGLFNLPDLPGLVSAWRRSNGRLPVQAADGTSVGEGDAATSDDTGSSAFDQESSHDGQ